MRGQRTGGVGEVGELEVLAKFKRIGWGGVRNDRDELGTDLLLLPRDDRGYDRGGLLGVQVKAGKSWFEGREAKDWFDGNQERMADGVTRGWWYYESPSRHFSYWIDHHIPHIVVLYDLDQAVAYWEFVDAERVVSLPRGAKILVPTSQTVDEAHAAGLLEIATAVKSRVTFQGTNWTGDPSISPARKLRYCLLAPRLVAPHPNANVATRPIDAYQGIALVMQARLHDLDRYASSNEGVPTLAEAKGSRSWTWRMFAAVGEYVLNADIRELQGCIEDAPEDTSRAAIAVLIAVHLIATEQWAAAIEHLSEFIGEDFASPIDQAWMLTHRAIAHFETGRLTEARDDCAAAQRNILGDPQDPTASELAGACAWLIFLMADIGTEDIGATIQASDTVISWWRNQWLSSGLDDVAEKMFRSWVQDRSVRYGAADVANNELYVAQLNAQLAGRHNHAKVISRRLAKYRLGAAEDAEEVAAHLRVLVSSGDHTSVKQVATRIWNVGPLAGLREVVGEPPDWILTSGHTAALSRITLLARAGDLVDEDTADAYLRGFIDTLDAPEGYAERVGSTFAVTHHFYEAMPRLMGAASRAGQELVGRHFARVAAGFVDSSDALYSARRVAGSLRAGDLEEATVDELVRTASDAGSGPFWNAILRSMANKSAEAVDVLIRRVAKGDLAALEGMNPREFEPEKLVSVMKIVAAKCRDTITAAQRGSYAGDDPAAVLTQVGLTYPEIVDWQAIVDLLADPQVDGGHKRRTCRYLAWRIDSVPEDVRQGLRDLGEIGAPSCLTGFMPPLGGSGILLQAALGSLTHVELFTAFDKLLGGDTTARCDALTLLGNEKMRKESALLIGALHDEAMEVRAVAARVLVVIASRSNGRARDLELVGLRSAASVPGAQLPYALVDQAADRGEVPAEVRTILEPLAEHPSAVVRNTWSQVGGGG